MSSPDNTSAVGSPALPSSSSSPLNTSFMRVVNAESLGALTSEQKGFISSVIILESNADLTGVQLKRVVAEMFPPAVLFGKELCDLSAVHIELRNVLDSRGANLRQHSSHRVINTLGHGLYEETEDTQAAVEMARAIVAAGRRPRTHLSNQPGSQSCTPGTNIDTTEGHARVGELARNITMRLKEREKTFSADLGESWVEFVDEYSHISRDYNLNPSQKLQYLHTLLHGDAKSFFLDKVDG